MSFSNREEVAKYAKDEGVEMVSITNIDLAGRWKHMTIPVDQLKDDLFENGLGLSLASYPGYKPIEAGDGRAVPDATTAHVDIFPRMKTLRMLCDIREPDGREFNKDPRGIARKAEAYLNSLGLGYSLWLPELEFYLFDDVRFTSDVDRCLYMVDAEEAYWNADRDERPNLGYKIGYRKGSQGMPPRDHLHDLRDLMVRRIKDTGLPVRYHHHESGAAGQMEIELLSQPLLRAADAILIAKYIIRNTAIEFGKTATFMPKPLFGEPGSGLHIHISLVEGEKSLFWQEKCYACLSELALQFIGGLLAHTPAIMAFTNSTTNSYKRFAAGQAAPANLSFSMSNRTSAVRIPGYAMNQKDQRIEYRIPDAASNPYLVLAATLMGGLDGIRNKMDPRNLDYGPFDINLHEIPAEEKATMKRLPSTLQDALNALEKDHEFLLSGDVFDRDFIHAWIELKTKDDVSVLNQRPHPHEFTLYYDI
jgi:glutamine synthetase